MAVSRRFIFRIVNFLILGTILLCLLIHCTSADDIRLEAMNTFIAMHKTAITNMDSELVKTDKQRYDAELDLLKLEQVTTPALQWLEFQRARDFNPGDWFVNIAPEGLDQLKNDQYRITKIEFYISRAGSFNEQVSSTLEVMDMTTGMIHNWEEVKSNLVSIISSRKQQWQEKLKQRDLSISTFKNLSKDYHNWKVKRINQSVYAITGNSLGWSDKLASGTWTYYRDKKEMIAADEYARALQKVLLMEF